MKKLTKQEILRLENKAKEIREEIINEVSLQGGHLSSNLGVVELTMMIHEIFDLTKDTLIFDVSHQCYTHKILTGRPLKKLGKYQGLSGFTNPTESIYDKYSVGHSSTSIALAIGEAIKRKELGEIGNIIVVIGDASISNGLAVEALNYLSEHKELKIIIIINDNNRGISTNVGIFGKTLNKIRIQRNRALIYRLTPKFTHKFFDRLKRSFKGAIYQPSFLDAYQIKHLDGIDGHNFKELYKYLQFGKHYNESIILHVKTLKGKGYPRAENDELGIWHNVPPFNKETGIFYANELSVGSLISQYLVKNQYSKYHYKVLCAGMVLNCGLSSFQEHYPQDLIDVGIAEEMAVTMASAITTKGQKQDLIPLVFIYSTFLQRAYDEILHDAARCNKHIILMIDHAGIVEKEGSTHQGIFDLSFLTPIPNITILAPSSIKEAYGLLDYACTLDGMVAIRYPKYLPDINSSKEINDFSKWDIIKTLNDINIITYGADVYPFKELIEQEELNIGLINARIIKPLDDELLKTISQTKVLIVYEQVNSVAGLFDLINNYYHDYKNSPKLKQMALFNTFLEEGSIEELKEINNLRYTQILDYLNNLKEGE